jgi:hypothetical protein
MGKEDFSGDGPAFLVVQLVAAIRCNQRLICGSVFEFFLAPSVTAVIILARSCHSYPRLVPMSQGGFGVMGVRLSASVP